MNGVVIIIYVAIIVLIIAGYWTVGLFFLPFIFIPILGFGSDTYQGPNGVGGAMATA